MTWVIDASVALKWFLRDRPDEADADAALALLQAYARGEVALLQPPHFLAEVCAVLARTRPEAMADDLADLLDLALPVRGDAAVYALGMQISRDLGHHLFDTLYHALALSLPSAVLVTADRRYFDKARHLGQIAWLPDFRSA